MKSKVLIVFIDAFGPAQLSRFREHFRFLEHESELQGILGYTSGALPTVLTGSTPDQHGRMCLFSERESGKTSILRPLKWLGLLPKVVHERSPVRHLAEKAIAKVSKLEGYVALHKVPPALFDWLDTPERDDMFTAATVGGERTFLTDARSAGLNVYSAPWQLQEERRWEHSFAAIRTQNPDLTFLYSTELDSIMHSEGPNGEIAENAAHRIAENIRQAREMLASDGSKLTTLVVGDHGMAEIENFLDPREMLAQIGDMRLFVDSTMIRAWGTDAELCQLRVAIEKQSWPGKWLQGSSLENRQVPQNHAFGKAMYVLKEGSMFAPSFLGGRVAGMHGYDLSCSSSKAALASDQPIGLDVAGIRDVAGIVRRELDLG